MDPEITQPSLLSRVRDPGDQAAWREFEAKYRELLLRYARRRGMQPADAEDVRQVVMINLAKYLCDFQYDPQRGRFRSHLGRMVRNAVARLANKRDGAVEFDTKAAATVPGVDEGDQDEVWEQEWRDHHYRLALDALRARSEPRSFEVFEALIAGESPEAVATARRMNIEAVYKIKQRMRERLKTQIADQIRDEDDFGAAN